MDAKHHSGGGRRGRSGPGSAGTQTNVAVAAGRVGRRVEAERTLAGGVRATGGRALPDVCRMGAAGTARCQSHRRRCSSRSFVGRRRRWDRPSLRPRHWKCVCPTARSCAEPTRWRWPCWCKHCGGVDDVGVPGGGADLRGGATGGHAQAVQRTVERRRRITRRRSQERGDLRLREQATHAAQTALLGRHRGVGVGEATRTRPLQLPRTE